MVTMKALVDTKGDAALDATLRDLGMWRLVLQADVVDAATGEVIVRATDDDEVSRNQVAEYGDVFVQLTWVEFQDGIRREAADPEPDCSHWYHRDLSKDMLPAADES